jgi:hypothetical protein
MTQVAMRDLHSETGREESTFCHPEQSEGSAFLFGFQENADSLGKHRLSA